MSARALAKTMCDKASLISVETVRVSLRRCFHIVAVLLFMSQLGGCVKNEVKVEFQLPEKVNDAYKLVYYASDPVKGWFVETVAAVQRGKAQITCVTHNPALVFIMGSGSQPRAVFYAERGDKINIAGDGNDPIAWNITGNKLTEEWSAWRIASRKALSSADPGQINKAVRDYVSKNPDKPLSTLLLLVYFDRRVDAPGFHRLWKSLKDKALEPKWMRLVSRADILGESPLFPQKTGSMVLHTYGNGVDTLSVGKKAAVLYFWRGSDVRRDEGIEVMGRLAKDYPDSAARILADICFDPDSIAWRSKVVGDSIAKVVRGWNFRGETDSVIMRMGVERTPWFIVYDSKGREVYAGDNPERVDKAFRNSVKR